MAANYPTSLLGLDAWAKATQTPTAQAKTRLVQFAILRSIAASQRLSDNLAFKGGNALDFFWAPNRSTRDLDFSAVQAIESDDDIPNLRTAFGRALETTHRLMGIRLRVQSVRPKGPQPGKTFTTFEFNIAYAFPGDPPGLLKKFEAGTCPTIVPVEISNNEVVYDTEARTLDGDDNELQISTLSDIVAEKLRSLLQQKVRRRTRRQDVLDIAFVRMEVPELLDRDVVAKALVRKSEARDIVATKSAFRDSEIRDRASRDYPQLAQTTRRRFIPFEEAFAEVLGLVDSLHIPES